MENQQAISLLSILIFSGTSGPHVPDYPATAFDRVSRSRLRINRPDRSVYMLRLGVAALLGGYISERIKTPR